MNRKFIAAAAALAFVLAGSASFASNVQGRQCGEGQRPKAMRYMGPGPVKQKGEMSAAQKAQMQKLRSLNEELRKELSKQSPDKAKARSLNGRILDIRQSMENDRFNSMLENARRGRGPKCGREVSAAERAKMEELFAARRNLMDELHKDTPDKAKATELHNKESRLSRELAEARFDKMLNDPARMKKFSERRGERKLSSQTKAKFEKLRTVNESMRAEAQKSSPDKAKLRSLHSQAQQIRNSLDDERFEQSLKDQNGMRGYGMDGRHGRRGGRGPECGGGMERPCDFGGGDGPAPEGAPQD